MNFYPQNFWIPLLVMLPNIIFALFPPSDTPVEPKRPSYWKIVIFFERIGQVGIVVLPFFWKLRIDRIINSYPLIIMTLCTILYYYCWVRYLKNGRKFHMLYEKFFIVLIPLAILPVIYYFAASIALNSWVLAFFTIILGIGHIPEGYMCYLENKK